MVLFFSAIFVFLWQDSPSLIRRIWTYLNYPFNFGRITISAAALIQGAIVLMLAVVLSRFLSTLLERRISKRGYIDPGLGYTIGRLAKYLVMTVGILVFLQVAFGLNLTSIAVVFTALSVGIGFGLQYIAADIASGFILLFERPIRVGDRITIDNDEGDVHSINMRTTIVNTNDRVAIIVPNSKLVSQRVINWSYGDPRARISIPVSVASDSDIDLVTETMLRASEDIDRVLTDPPPKVQFLKFGDYSLDFRLLVWTRQPNHHPQIRSDINYRIARLFREKKIELSHPVQELRVIPTDQPLRDIPLADPQDSLRRRDGD